MYNFIFKASESKYALKLKGNIICVCHLLQSFIHFENILENSGVPLVSFYVICVFERQEIEPEETMSVTFEH